MKRKLYILPSVVGILFVAFVVCNSHPFLAKVEGFIGGCYNNGFFVFKDRAEAAKWFQKAAEGGDALAQNRLGNCYIDGDGVEENKAEGLKWIHRSADQGCQYAQNTLGSCYFRGIVVETNKEEAVKWWQKAAVQGLAEAQWNLGFCYLSGEGVSRDDDEAAEWYKKAAAQGNADAADILKKMDTGATVKSIQNILKQNQQLNLEFNQAVEQINLDKQKRGDGAESVANLAPTYVDKAKLIQINDCPRDFAEAYYRYLGAWLVVADEFDAHPPDETTFESFSKIVARTLAHDYQGPERDVNEMKAWRENLMQATTEVTKAWNQVEVLVVHYGAK